MFAIVEFANSNDNDDNNNNDNVGSSPTRWLAMDTQTQMIYF